MINITRKRSISYGYLFLAALVAIGVGVAIVRLFSGLGSTTGLSDAYPWGLWIVYDIFFVPCSGAAFMILAITHIYGREDFHDIARPVVLAGFLGELTVIAVLLMDLGRWHQFYNVLFPWNWNINSFMFQVSICLTIYMGVMILEVAPAILERFKLKKLLRVITMATVVISAAGILLSSLHQSSLGSLFLLMPYKLHPLWWSPMLPLLFFTSAVFTALSMVILIVTLSFKAFRRPLEPDLKLKLGKLGQVASILLGLYLALKLADLVAAGEMGLVFSSGIYSVLFLAEIILGVVLPIFLFNSRKARSGGSALAWGTVFVLIGTALNRTNVALLAYQAPAGAVYQPHWMEIMISIAAVAAAILLFVLAARFLPILPKDGNAPETSTALWPRRTIAIVGGSLVLLTVAVVLLFLPTTQAEAAKLQAGAGSAGALDPREGPCQACHVDPQALTNAGANQDQVETMTIELLPAGAIHGEIRCVTCHYGNDATEDLEAAHVDAVLDPSIGNADVCLACHTDLPAEFPEDRLRTPHDEVTHGVVSGVACSDCHGAVGHGFDPMSGEYICPMAVCLGCHLELKLESKLSDCSACHISDHESPLNMECDDCHLSTDTWAQVEAVEHKLDLAGQHAELTCLDCHQTYDHSAGHECVICHESPDQKHYGAACSDCHSTEGFRNATLPNHPGTVLQSHSNVVCGDCHPKGSTSSELACSSCHEASGLKAMAVPHTLASRADCLLCHGPVRSNPYPQNHGGWDVDLCLLCHETNDTPTEAEHVFPMDHQGASENCELCHPDGSYPEYSCEKCHGQASFEVVHTKYGVKFEPNCVDCHPEGKGVLIGK